MTTTPLGPGVEFDLIRRLTTGVDDEPPGVELGPGDDAAVLEGGWVISTDLAVEEVHFRRSWLSPEDIGGRAVRAALSDLAAMAAAPVGVFLSMAGSTSDHADGVLEALGRGARAAAAACGAALLGGDLTRSPGPLVIDVVALGRTSAPVRRRGARPGDGVWVTGRLGLAAVVTERLSAGEGVSDEARLHFARPAPRMAEARWLAATGQLHALLDLSDGLTGDAGHLAAASGVCVELDEAAIPVDGRAEALVGETAARRAALSGGEDYELLFAADPGFDERAPAFRVAFPEVRLTRVGRIEAGSGVRLRAADGTVREAEGAFDHFGSGAPDRGERP